MLKFSDFDYRLPKELIAQYPLKKRTHSRLLVLHRESQQIEHRLFKDIRDYFQKGDLLVLNDTRVLTCRLKGRRLSGGKVEVLLLRPKEGAVFNALIKPSRVKIGEEIIFNGGQTTGVISAKNEIAFNLKNKEEVYKLGVMPLPPYIKREPEGLDNIYYQTVYARKEGAIAAPTAGLHFSQGLLKEIQASGVNIAYLTLHVGIGTFKPVRVEDITQHKMEEEYFEVSAETVKKIRAAKNNKKRLFSVGTTTCRALETIADRITDYRLPVTDYCGLTDLFIYPGYEFKVVNALLTNFHLPRTSLFMLVCAFVREKFMKRVYREAIAREYRFYSYGDAMLII